MILVDILIPSLDKTYDFRLDETARIEHVIEEISVMVSQKEQCEIRGNKDELLLYSYEGHVVLNREFSLSDMGIKDGAKLLLV